MRTFFWSVITVILILVVISLVLYSGEEEGIVEPRVLGENISNTISNLRAAVDEMEVKYNNMQEIAAIALAAGNTRNARNWFAETEKIQAAIMNIFDEDVSQINEELMNSNLPESVEKQVGEFMERARGLISIDSQRDMLVVRNTIGLHVSPNEWMALAKMYEDVSDTYERNMGLKALGETIEKFNEVLAGTIYSMIDAPFVKAIYEAGKSASAAVGSLVDGLEDPFLIMQVLIIHGKKNLNDNVIDALTGLLDKVDDDNEKAYFASRILVQLPKMPESARATFFSAVEKADDHRLLMAETKMSLAENPDTPVSTRKLCLNDIEAAVDEIPQNYPRERIKARLIMQKTGEPLDVIFSRLDEIKSVTLREQVLTYTAINKKDLVDGEFGRIINALDDSYSKLAAGLEHFYKKEMQGEPRVSPSTRDPDFSGLGAAFLTSLEGYAEDVKVTRPLIELTAAWGTVDPFHARQCLNRFDTKNKVDAVVALVNVLKDKSTVSIILDDMYTELIRSKQFEPVAKSQLLRKLAEPMQNINPQKATKLLEEAFRLVAEH